MAMQPAVLYGSECWTMAKKVN